MHRGAKLALLFFALSGVSVLRADPPTRCGWTLIWNDEFDGFSISSSRWDWGGLPWGGQYHKSEYSSVILPEDSYLDGSGRLVLRSRQGSFPYNDTTYPWSEGMVHTINKMWYTYGYIEIRAQHTMGKGIWPAFWSLSNGWPPEFDIAEFFGSRWPDQMHAGLAYGPDWQHVTWNNTYYAGNFWEWHSYGLEWGPNYANLYMDTNVKHSMWGSFVPSVPMYVILNSGMRWDYDGSTPAPNYYKIDHIRLYKRNELVYNPGFENATGPWNVRNGAGASTERPYLGSASLRIAGAGNGAAEQMIYGLLPNTTYFYNGYGSRSNGAPTLYCGVKDHGTAEVNTPITSTAWRYFSVPFTTGYTNTTALLYAWESEASANPVYADDLYVRRAAVVNNPGFETGDLNGWDYNYGSRSVVRAGARSGDYSLKLGSNTWTGCDQVIRGLRPNTTYQLSGWTMNGVYLGAKDFGGSEINVSIPGPIYAKGTVAFQTGPTNTTATVYAFAPYLLADAYVDDLFLAEALASPWQRADIGTGIPAGASGLRGTNFVVCGSGLPWYGADAVHFVYRALTNDGQITARVRSLDNPFPYAKVGISLRETLAAGAKHVGLFWLPNPGLGVPPVVETITRSTTGGNAGAAWRNNVSAPPWLRLVRSNNTFFAYYSTDGASWTTVTTNTIVMSSNILVGLTACANTMNDLSEGTLDNVSVVAVDSDLDGIPDAWELTQFGNLTTATATSDYDGDGFADYHEWLCGLNPKVKQFLTLTRVTRPSPAQVQIEFYGVPGVDYPVQSSASLGPPNWANVASVTRTTDPANKQGGLILHCYTLDGLSLAQSFVRVRLR